MAFASGNVDRPNGFVPVRHLTGGIIRANAYSIASGYGSDIFSGDPVKSTGTGKNVAVAAAGNTAVGVFAGCEYIDSNGEVIFRPYWPASTTVETGTTVTAWVFDDPDIVFAIQGDGDVAEADIRQHADFVAGTGDTSTGRSAYELDSSDIGTGDNLKILGLVDRADNDYGTNAEVEVLFNEHELRGTTSEV